MLILTRRISETLMVGDDVTITALKITGNQVKIGVEAPNYVAGHCKEVYLRIRNEQITVNTS